MRNAFPRTSIRARSNSRRHAADDDRQGHPAPVARAGMSQRLLADVHARAGGRDQVSRCVGICSAKEFDGDFRGGLGDRFLNLLGGPDNLSVSILIPMSHPGQIMRSAALSRPIDCFSSCPHFGHWNRISCASTSGIERWLPLRMRVEAVTKSLPRMHPLVRRA